MNMLNMLNPAPSWLLFDLSVNINIIVNITIIVNINILVTCTDDTPKARFSAEDFLV